MVLAYAVFQDEALLAKMERSFFQMWIQDPTLC